MLSLHQKLSQQQRLSPQQIQYQKLLQLNTMALEQRIKNELEINPVLEEIMDEEIDVSMDQIEKDKDSSSDDDVKSEADDYENNEFELEDYMNDSEMDYDFERTNRSKNDEPYQPLAHSRESLSERLLEQLRMLELDDDIFRLGEEIIGNLDQDGYLQRELSTIVEELRMFEHLNVTDVQAEKILKKIQRFEPIGIAARSLQECLLIQLHNNDFDSYYKYLAEQLLTIHFDDFTKKRYEAIKQKMNLTDDSLKAVIELIQHLNPKPGEGNIESAELNQITPDFVLEKVENNFIITLNDRSMPSVTISRTYLEMFNINKRAKKNNRDKNTYKFLREKFESAKWFIACIQQRRETLMKIMQAILEKQWQFFERGPKFLRPMIYKDIAEEIMMDISTISRVVNGKYVQSPMGVHELKYFFSEGLGTDQGEEVSNKHIKERLKELIEAEDKQSPLSDDKLADILIGEGIHIARRTVAKYREQLKLPIARLRREL
ncbi:MAG: RNA polymerase sigma-54 factor [Ignavibacteria bacterium CG2_30_36_16]|nr:RNA polymerase factor sigma-54 [Ignavibacteria bacterium]OIP58271.1 MAG: RNA polymerase sigma-54 factor [Ignavibacteria bacterium CG2_30_36_16]